MSAVTVTLTLAEAKALWQAAGEVLDHYDAALVSFPNPSTRAAAGRGHDKLATAWVRAAAGAA
jgi:hypothetical protein